MWLVDSAPSSTEHLYEPTDFALGRHAGDRRQRVVEGQSQQARSRRLARVSLAQPLVTRMQDFGTTIFAEMSALAVATGSVNLGQGFPDTDGPAEMLRAAADAITTGTHNQYPPGPGIPELRQAVAAHQ